MVLMAPSLLSSDFSRLGEELDALAAAQADMVHLDIMDGHFVPNITFGPPVVAALRTRTSLVLDAHLMIENPDEYLQDFAQAGADYIGVHWEACRHLNRTLNRIRELGKKTVLALNPHTPADFVEPVLELCDMVLVMSVNPGFGGQKFIPQSLAKIAFLRKLIDDRNLPTLIQVDGGVNEQTIGQVVRAGADVLVAGSAVFNPPGPVHNLPLLRSLVLDAG